MCLYGLFVLIQPVLVAGIYDVFRTLILQNLHLLSSSYNVQEWNVFFLTEFVEHPSQSWSCSRVYHSFSSRSSVTPFSKHINKSDDCDWVDHTRSFWFDWNIVFHNPTVCYIGNCIFCPCSLNSIEGNFFAHKIFP